MQGRIVINPQVLSDERDALAVAYNEAYRAVMEMQNFVPQAEPTPEQMQFFADTAYANDPLMMKRTIVARIATYDTSVPNPTPEQYMDTVNMLRMVQESGVIQTPEEEEIVSSTLADMEQSANAPMPMEAVPEAGTEAMAPDMTGEMPPEAMAPDAEAAGGQLPPELMAMLGGGGGGEGLPPDLSLGGIPTRSADGAGNVAKPAWTAEDVATQSSGTISGSRSDTNAFKTLRIDEDGRVSYDVDAVKEHTIDLDKMSDTYSLHGSTGLSSTSNDVKTVSKYAMAGRMIREEAEAIEKETRGRFGGYFKSAPDGSGKQSLVANIPGRQSSKTSALGERSLRSTDADAIRKNTLRVIEGASVEDLVERYNELAVALATSTNRGSSFSKGERQAMAVVMDTIANEAARRNEPQLNTGTEVLDTATQALPGEGETTNSTQPVTTTETPATTTTETPATTTTETPATTTTETPVTPLEPDASANLASNWSNSNGTPKEVSEYYLKRELEYPTDNGFLLGTPSTTADALNKLGAIDKLDKDTFSSPWAIEDAYQQKVVKESREVPGIFDRAFGEGVRKNGEWAKLYSEDGTFTADAAAKFEALDEQDKARLINWAIDHMLLDEYGGVGASVDHKYPGDAFAHDMSTSLYKPYSSGAGGSGLSALAKAVISYARQENKKRGKGTK